MVSPALWREVVAWAQQAYRLSERRAARAVGAARSSIRYKSVKAPREPLRRRIREVAEARTSWGYRQVHTILLREGWQVNHKLVYRLYREEGLTLRRKRPKRRRMAMERTEVRKTTRPNERWAMDFVHDATASGRGLRVFAAVDVHTRECVALQVARKFTGEDVAGILSDAGAERSGLPDVISVDQGTEFTSKSLDHWGYWNRVRLDFSRPGKPTDNAFAEAFNSLLRRECLSQHYFIDEEDAQRILDRWRADYNNFRPHGSLARSTPAAFAASALDTQGPREPDFSHF